MKHVLGRKSAKKIYNFSSLSCLLLITLFSGCSNSVEERKNIICLIDYSGSISEVTLNNYASIISKDIFENLGPHDKFSVMPIDEGAKTQPVYLAYYDFKSEKFYKNSDGVTHKQDSLKKRLSRSLSSKSDSISSQIKMQKEIRKKFTSYTDIINALEQLPTKLERNNSYSKWDKMWNSISGNTVFHTENILVICSDMIHESKEFDFNKRPTIKKNELDGILKQLKSANRIPDLNGLVVFVNGRTGRNNQQIDNIQFFWQSYLKECHAVLKSYEFDGHHSIVDYLQTSSN